MLYVSGIGHSMNKYNKFDFLKAAIGLEFKCQGHKNRF